jgi:hypothetical protein
MPTWSVECTGVFSVTGKPESNCCKFGASADPFLDISCVLMSLRVKRLTARHGPCSVERLLVSVVIHVWKHS